MREMFVFVTQVRAGLAGCLGPANPDGFQLTCSAHHCTGWLLKPQSVSVAHVGRGVGKMGTISRVSGVCCGQVSLSRELVGMDSS